jgi:alkylation response protein AidB-like acyl-CoA dehydrogenase
VTSYPPDLPEEHRELLGVVADFAERELRDRSSTDEEHGRFPRDVFTALGELGLMGLPFPADVGGGEVAYRTYLLVLEELSRVWLTVGLGVSVHTLATWGMESHGTTEQRDRLVPAMVAGELLGAYSLPDPHSGSDAGTYPVTWP